MIVLNDSIIKKLSKVYDIPAETLQKLFSILSHRHLMWASIGQGWRYPETGDDQKSAPMLDAMFHIEKREGVIIFMATKNRGEACNSEAEIRVKKHTL